jgi:Mg/Co/Ni transporter MgtE
VTRDRQDSRRRSTSLPSHHDSAATIIDKDYVSLKSSYIVEDELRDYVSLKSSYIVEDKLRKIKAQSPGSAHRKEMRI